MNMSRLLFVVLLMSIISMALSSVALAAPPAASISGVPANIVSGTSFKATVTGAASSAPAGQAITTLTFASNNENFYVSPGSQTCAAGSTTCIAEFSVSVSSAAPIGSSATFTAVAVASNGESDAKTAVSAVSGAPSAGNRVPVRVDSVEVDGFELSTLDTNVRDLERGEEFTLKVKLAATANANDVEVRAFVSGYEFSASEDISDEVSPFNVEKGVTYVKSLKLKLPERADEGRYRIRVVVAGRDTEDITQNFRIKITPSDHEVVIRDFSVNPEEVQAGRAVLATVRVKNLGDSTEDDVKIKVSVPELGVSAAPDFVDSLKSEESATSEEFFLRIDPCAKPGAYDVTAEVTFEEGDKVVTARRQVTVAKGACEAVSGPSAVTSGSVKIYAPEPQAVQAGSSASYPITIKNDGSATKSFSLSASGSEWASVKFSSPVVIVKPGDSQVVYAVVTPNSNVLGGKTLVVNVKDQAGDVVNDVSVAANVVAGGKNDVASMVQLLQVGLIALIVVLVVVGLVVAFRRMKGPREGEEGTQTYY